VLQEIKPTHYPKQIDSFIRVFEIMRGEFDSVWTTMEKGSIKLQRRSSLNLLGEAGTDFQISK
jgi:hypothetical protein